MGAVYLGRDEVVRCALVSAIAAPVHRRRLSCIRADFLLAHGPCGDPVNQWPGTTPKPISRRTQPAPSPPHPLARSSLPKGRRRLTSAAWLCTGGHDESNPPLTATTGTPRLLYPGSTQSLEEDTSVLGLHLRLHRSLCLQVRLRLNETGTFDRSND